MSLPTWTILIPTIPQREHLFRRLLDFLLPQLDAHEGRVTVLAWRNAGKPALGELRDRLIAAAHARGSDYVSFVDDDDMVPEYYVSEIVKALAHNPDHVGFKLGYHMNGPLEEVVLHSLKWNTWRRSPDGVLVRDVTHIDPVRTVFAKEARFGRAPAGRAEDRVWVKQVRRHLVTEQYIDKIMYHYLFRDDTTSWAHPELITAATTPLPVIDHPHFAWHPESDS